MFCVFSVVQYPGSENPLLEKFTVFPTLKEADKNVGKLLKYYLNYLDGEDYKYTLKGEPVRVVYNGDVTAYIYLRMFRLSDDVRKRLKE